MKLHAEMAPVVEFPQARILCGARVAIDPWHTVSAALLVRRGKIEAIVPDAKSAQWVAPFARIIDLKGHLILPGLVNAHDHLHFGVFPRLGQGPYPSWREWAKDIYRPEDPPLRALLEIPKEERLWWGIVRNAFSGVTTVCHHDPAHSMLTNDELPVTVHPRFGWAHSLDGRTWKDRYAQTPVDWPFIVHCAEGLNSRSRQEVAKLDREGKLNHRMVLVHAVGINKKDLSKLKTGGAWIVWCPTSNLHILGRTLDRDLLLSYPFIALGSDSPISASGDLLDELQVAHQQFDIPADLLYAMVTRRAAQLLRLTEREGSISAGGVADLLIVRDNNCSPCETLATLKRDDLAAVMHKGEFTVASEEFYIERERALPESLIPIERYGLSWHVAAPPDGLGIRPQPPFIEPVCAVQTELTKQ
jgi:cytosine/adenosine deaminase-related metal-dependent hydrolase